MRIRSSICVLWWTLFVILEAIEPLKAPYFLTRREMGIFNVGGPGVVRAGNAVFEMDYKEALYLGSGDREVTFESKDAAHPAKFYFNSVTAHRNYPDKKVTKKDAVVNSYNHLFGICSQQKMCIVQDFPVGSCRYGCFESDRYFRCKFIADRKAAFALAVVNESTNELIQIGGGISRGIVNTEYIFFVRKFFL